MKYFILVGFLIYAITLSAKNQETIRIYNSVLTSGEQLEFGNKSIQFKAVISDSRYPEAVTCVWAGEAKVLIEIFEEGKPINEKQGVINRNILDEIPLQVSDGDVIYSINTLRLFPYPTGASKKN